MTSVKHSISKHSIKVTKKKTEFEINNTSSFVLYVINIALVIDGRTSNSREKSKENSKFEIYSHT